VCAIAARMEHGVALVALDALGLSRAPFHETFHANGKQRYMTITERSDRNRLSRGAHRRLTAMVVELAHNRS
jgi:hypothetical protein